MIKVSLIVTVLNEAETIQSLLESIRDQSRKPEEVIIVDGGSTDATIAKIEHFVHMMPSDSDIALKFAIRPGNRSVGRNYAVQLAQHELIAITDAGCTLHKDWLQNLTRTYTKTGAEVVAGYYDSKPQTLFQKAVVPYVLVMPKRVDPENFLPATRSMLIEKQAFQKLGGFDERYGDNEDYVFAKKIESHGIRRAFAQDAVVYWRAVSTLQQFYTMIYRFARGDVYAGILRPKVPTIFLRYIIFLVLLEISTSIFIAVFLLYLVWSIAKNIQYAKNAWSYLPLLQVVSDVAVMHGTVVGFIKRFLVTAEVS